MPVQGGVVGQTDVQHQRFTLKQHRMLEGRSDRCQLRTAASPPPPVPRCGIASPGPSARDVMCHHHGGRLSGSADSFCGFASPSRLTRSPAPQSRDMYFSSLNRTRLDISSQRAMTPEPLSETAPSVQPGTRAPRHRTQYPNPSAHAHLPVHERPPAGMVQRRHSNTPTPLTLRDQLRRSELPPRDTPTPDTMSLPLPCLTASAQLTAPSPSLYSSTGGVSAAGSRTGARISPSPRRKCSLTAHSHQAIIDKHGQLFDSSWGKRFDRTIHRRKGWKQGEFGVPGGPATASRSPPLRMTDMD